jgi:hypothetical protein
MTAAPVRYVLDELGAVADDQPTAHPLFRADRDYSLVMEDGGDWDAGAARERRESDPQQANLVGARYGAPDRSYIGTAPNLDLQEVVGVRVRGFSGDFGHADAAGDDGVVFHGTDNALVQQCIDQLLSGLKHPDAGRTDVSFTDLRIANESPGMPAYADELVYTFDVLFNGYEDL